MKKTFPLFIIFFMVFSLFCFNVNSNFSFALEIGKQAKVIASQCDVYQSADFNSDKITIASGEQNLPLKLKHGEIVLIIEESGEFSKVKTKEGIEGFVYKYYLTQNSSQTVYPVLNGTVRNETIIYDMDFEDSGFTVKKGERVYIYKSYSEKENFTAVQVVLEDQSLYNGYIETKDVNPDGISGLLIAGISIIAAGVTIVLSIVFIKKKKRKKK